MDHTPNPTAGASDPPPPPPPAVDPPPAVVVEAASNPAPTAEPPPPPVAHAAPALAVSPASNDAAPPPSVGAPAESKSAPDVPPNESVTLSRDLTYEAPPPQPRPQPASYSAAMPEPSASETLKSTVETMREALVRWGKSAAETSKTLEERARNTWQHLNTGPSFTEAAMGRIAHGTKVIAEGGYERIFSQTFEMLPEERLKYSYACYLSTSAGPVMGVLYLSTAKVAFCSDNPLSYKIGDRTEWSYYKVVIPLHQLKSVSSSASNTNANEKYVQVVSIDDHEFWFMGFLRFENAIASLQETLNFARTLQP